MQMDFVSFHCTCTKPLGGDFTFQWWREGLCGHLTSCSLPWAPCDKWPNTFVSLNQYHWLHLRQLMLGVEAHFLCQIVRPAFAHSPSLCFHPPRLQLVLLLYVTTSICTPTVCMCTHFHIHPLTGKSSWVRMGSGCHDNRAHQKSNKMELPPTSPDRQISSSSPPLLLALHENNFGMLKRLCILVTLIILICQFK